MVAVASLVAAGALGLAQPPSLGIACRDQPNVTACGRIGIAVWLRRPALGVEATLRGVRVRLHAGGFGGRGPTYWEGYVHLDPRSLGLPRQWAGERPTRFLTLRLTIRYAGRTAVGSRGVLLRPGWGLAAPPARSAPGARAWARSRRTVCEGMP